MMALEEIGIKLRLGDFKLIFDALDYDCKSHIDFRKFCHLNADRYTLIDLIRMVSMKIMICSLRSKITSSHWVNPADLLSRLSRFQESKPLDQRPSY